MHSQIDAKMQSNCCRSVGAVAVSGVRVGTTRLLIATYLSHVLSRVYSLFIIVTRIVMPVSLSINSNACFLIAVRVWDELKHVTKCTLLLINSETSLEL